MLDFWPPELRQIKLLSCLSPSLWSLMAAAPGNVKELLTLGFPTGFGITLVSGRVGLLAAVLTARRPSRPLPAVPAPCLVALFLQDPPASFWSHHLADGPSEGPPALLLQPPTVLSILTPPEVFETCVRHRSGSGSLTTPMAQPAGCCVSQPGWQRLWKHIEREPSAHGQRHRPPGGLPCPALPPKHTLALVERGLETPLWLRGVGPRPLESYLVPTALQCVIRGESFVNIPFFKLSCFWMPGVDTLWGEGRSECMGFFSGHRQNTRANTVPHCQGPAELDAGEHPVGSAGLKNCPRKMNSMAT